MQSTMYDKIQLKPIIEDPLGPNDKEERCYHLPAGVIYLIWVILAFVSIGLGVYLLFE